MHRFTLTIPLALSLLTLALAACGPDGGDGKHKALFTLHGHEGIDKTEAPDGLTVVAHWSTGRDKGNITNLPAQPLDVDGDLAGDFTATFNTVPPQVALAGNDEEPAGVGVAIVTIERQQLFETIVVDILNADVVFTTGDDKADEWAASNVSGDLGPGFNLVAHDEASTVLPDDAVVGVTLRDLR